MFNFQKELNDISAVWRSFCLKRNAEREFVICGPKGCGKTRIVQDYVRNHSSAFYISFESLTDRMAIESFREQFISECDLLNNWDEAVKAFISKRNNNSTLLIFENNSNSYYKIFKKYAHQVDNIQICYLSDTTPTSYSGTSIKIGYRTLQDYFHAFPKHDRQDVLRLYALTGGVYTITKELDENMSYEENIRKLLSYDSVFSTTLPLWLTKCFRRPDSYYPIFKSIASGHHRLSEIAKDIEFPNNKCGKYLEALIKNNFVVAKKIPGSKQSTYHFANVYFEAWSRYICGNKSTQMTQPETLYGYVTDNIDNEMALHVFCDACIRFIQHAPTDYLNRLRDLKILSAEKSVSVKFKGREIILDYCVQTNDEHFVFILPKSVDMRYTKNEISDIYSALKIRDMYYNTNIVIFSINRFSDWCVHESKQNPYLHVVPLERLKY